MTVTLWNETLRTTQRSGVVFLLSISGILSGCTVAHSGVQAQGLAPTVSQPISQPVSQPVALTVPISARLEADGGPSGSSTGPSAARAVAQAATPVPSQPASAAPVPATPPAASGTQSSPPSGPVFTLPKVETNEVNQIFTVTDKKGRFVTGLKQEDFGLLDDGRPPISVVQFTQQTNLPLRVGVMLDTSSSIRQRFQFEQDSAVEFFLQVLHLNDRAFVEGFDVQTDIEQDFTNNIDLLNQGIRKLRPGGGTALFDALYKTCRDQMLTLRETGSVRKALVLVSDGDDNYSRAEESDAIKMCQRADTIVYAISTNISPTKDKGDDVLKTIAQATGGRAFYPVRIEDVALGFRNIEEELRSQYLLIYRPANFKQDGSFRTIYLHALNPGYQVRTRSGYFAPRPQ